MYSYKERIYVISKLEDELKRPRLAKIDQKNSLVIDFDNHPNKYPNWVPHLSVFSVDLYLAVASGIA